MKKVIYLAFVLMLAVFVSCGKSTSKDEMCTIKSRCFAVVDKAQFEEMSSAFSQVDKAALKKMIEKGDAYMLRAQTKCKMLKNDYDRVKVRAYLGKDSVDVWVSPGYIAKQ